METVLPFFIRQLYIHSLTYLLRGLPSDLSSSETMSLQSALPASMLTSFQLEVSDRALAPLPHSTAAAESEMKPSVLHRLVASAIVNLFLIFNLLLPYIQLVVAHAYRYERKYKISERVFRSSLTAVDEVSRRGLDLADAVCRLNDGKVGRLLGDYMVWWVRGVTGGIHQGLSDGLNALSAENKR